MHSESVWLAYETTHGRDQEEGTHEMIYRAVPLSTMKKSRIGGICFNIRDHALWFPQLRYAVHYSVPLAHRVCSIPK